MKAAVRTLSYALILLILGIGAAILVRGRAAAEGETGDSRRTEIVVSVNEYQWWLVRWANESIACVAGVDHDGIPSNLEILADCGETVYKEWLNSSPCTAAADSKDTSGCPGLYIFLAGQQTVEKNLVVDLPTPSVWLDLTGCSPQPPLSLCERLPSLALTGSEPLPNEVITAMHVKIRDRVIDCVGAYCEIPLEITAYDGDIIEFWADSSYGDESEHFIARVRVLDAGVQAPGAGSWFVDIISSQWRGSQASSCAAMWEAFPAAGEPPQWLNSPEDHTGLASDTPFVFLAGQLIRSGVVEISHCVDHGLLSNGAASQCGVEAARSQVNDWQDQFDAEIFSIAQEKQIPAQLLKNLFAQESQFWPGQATEDEFGFGQLTELGADTTLLWNVEFFDAFCPLVLHEETCGKGYAFIGPENQELLRGALAVQSGADCADCPVGVDLAHAQTTIRLFADTLVANCAQVSFIVSDITGEMPGLVAGYEDLWRFTLASYNAGPYCLARALNTTWSQFGTMDWHTVASRLSQGCIGAVTYVDRVTADRAPMDADFLPATLSTATPYVTPRPGSTPAPAQPTPTDTGGYPAPDSTSDPGGYPAPGPTATPQGYP